MMELDDISEGFYNSSDYQSWIKYYIRTIQHVIKSYNFCEGNVIFLHG